MKKNLTIQHCAVIGVMTAVICVLAPFSIPIGVVPLSFANLAIFLTVYVLGGKRATISCFIYLCIGLTGIPVFSGFTGGPGKLFGPTGGYLNGYLVLAVIAGVFIDRFADKMYLCFLGIMLGTAVCNLLGTLWLACQSGITFAEALMIGVVPFIPGDLAKIVIAIVVGPRIRRQLVRAGM